MFSIQKAFNRAVFKQMPGRDQDEALQRIYDQKYSVKDIAEFLNIGEQTLRLMRKNDDDV